MDIRFKRIGIFLTIWSVLLCFFIFFQTTIWLSSHDRENLHFIDAVKPIFLEIQQNEFYSVSAFFDDRLKELPTVKVMAVGILNRINFVFCTYFDEGKTPIGTVLGKHEILYMKTKHKFQAIWVNCPVIFPERSISTTSPRPFYVSLNTKNLTNAVAYPISYPPGQDGHYKFKYQMGMCVQPFFGEWEDPIGLIEWIEFHKLLGADHFTFYNYSLGKVSAKVLASYGPEEVVVLPWSVSYEPSLMQNNAQVVQVNDCLYRYIGVAEMVGSVDVDEFIMPGSSELDEFQNYAQMFQGIAERQEAKQNGKSVASIRFPSKFSFEQFPYKNVSGATLKPGESPSTQELEIANRLRIFTRLNRASSSGYSYKHKFVAFPHRIVEAEVHSTPIVLENTTAISVPPEVVHFVHFRNCTEHYIHAYCFKCDYTCLTMKYEEDVSMLDSFGTKLLQNVAKKVKSLSHLKLMEQ